MDLFLSIELVNSKLEFFKELKDINELRSKIVEFYANEFYNGKTDLALEELHRRMSGRTTKEFFSIGIFIGIAIFLIFTILLVGFIGNLFLFLYFFY